MIHIAVAIHRPLPAHACGHTPQLIEARGRTITDSRLFGRPARMYHVECCHCGIATAPVWSPRTALHQWRAADRLVPTTDLHALRIAAERALASAA